MSTGRVEAFSDGVIAVAITLLVLNLRVPITNGSLLAALADEWPAFVAFFISFLGIGIVWVNHHAFFHSLARVDRTMLFANLGFLMAVVLIPFTTSLFAEYVGRTGSQASVAAALFNGAQLLMGVGFQSSRVWVERHPGLLRPDAALPTRMQRFRVRAGMLVYIACIPIAFVSPIAVLVLDGLVGVYYIVDHMAPSAK